MDHVCSSPLSLLSLSVLVLFSHSICFYCKVIFFLFGNLYLLKYLSVHISLEITV